MKLKSLIVEVPEKDHREIKRRAAEKGMSIKRYVLKALAVLKIQEDQYK